MAAASGVIASLLVLAGVSKLRRPAAAQSAIPSWFPTSEPTAVRLVAAYEIALGGLVLLVGGPLLTGSMGLTYLGFTLVALRQRRTGASCGCLGDDGAPTTWLHIGFDATAGIAGLVIASTVSAPFHQAVTGPVELALAATLVATGAGLCRLLLTELPKLEASRRPLSEAAT